MEKDLSEYKKKKRTASANGASGGIYGLAFIGALIYFIQQATTFLDGRTRLFESPGMAGSTYLQGDGIFENVNFCLTNIQSKKWK
ncbi:MAG: hypothetical protein ACTHML_16435 [Ginsengibacter sp.]